MQGAYQVQVARNLADLEAGTLLWDAGRVASERSTSIQYEGPEGHSTQRIHWRVRVWDHGGKPSDWSGPAWTEMGQLEERDSVADWIEVG